MRHFHRMPLWLCLLAQVVTAQAVTAAPKPELDRPASFQSIRSVTFYDVATNPGSGGAFLRKLARALPAIQATGFNTIWLVCPWSTFNPRPLHDPPVYEERAFASLRQVLELLKAHHMDAIIGLDYLGRGWAPAGIDADEWLREPVMYRAFETYARRFLEEIEPYHRMVYILVFTENSEPRGMADAAHAPAVAALLRTTLGSLPARLPPALRAEYRIGYHDYSLINLGWAQGASPIQSPNPFDFLSMVAYGLEQQSDAAIAAELDRRAARFRALYPRMPLIIGESGASSCHDQDANQARVLRAIAAYALQRGSGLNVWGWQPGPPDQECANPVLNGLAITNQDGSVKQAALVLKQLWTAAGSKGPVPGPPVARLPERLRIGPAFVPPPSESYNMR